ncbi:site-specific DNA-methyltransferase [Anaerolinea thermophila]|uniref:DNA methyltransferase n=1 Tax=Anaerolinea thermophila (strain DSM 14523 / JCM 11388 / NBRC 100420 / UNI-1) TaxID=926569 RepID=E8MYS1_ANATU|nr:site-specific DNA-methyltransferase [Anaerolinea thermophila]BAJ64407.1 putative DNA methyltransferase [Anaerolinea thermophila UNI-1]
MSEPLQKFQSLLRELFEFDSADLDFGIYRIMNRKRQVIERFITEDLPKAVAEELRSGALAEQEQARKALEEARRKVLDALGEDALDANGNLAEKYRETKTGKEYLEAQTKAADTHPIEALEAAIYNHLYTFFSRYWQDGDFISKRRYSKKERYAIPYNGEEVYLYWANHDQYYVKTGEYFTDYTYKAPNGVTIHFKLRQADVEQNNVKGDKRFFLPALSDITWEEPTRTLIIPFEFRPLTEQENIAYGQKNQQEAIIAKAVAEIPKRVKNTEALTALSAECRKNEDDTPVSLLERHLRRYTRRNTGDFFIHKDLRGFLSRELDFYLKNEVLNLEEIEAAGEDLAEGWFQLLRLIKRVGNAIIDFLAQIEDFQKMLWEKKKFVTETFYVITVGNIPQAFYPEIAANDAQWKEWRALGFLEKKPDDPITFLQAHPTLPLDTRHFSPDFTDRLLASFDNLDEMTDGLLVHSENWQALNLLLEKYRERVKCVYIDPPFNTGKDDFLYKDGYQYASWQSMMSDRLGLLINLFSESGVFFSSISDHEISSLKYLLDRVFGRVNFVGNIEWNSTKTVTNTALISVGHTHNLVYARQISYFTRNRHHFRLPDPLEGFENPDNDPRGPWKADPFQVGGIRPNQQYEIVNPNTGRVYRPNPGCSWKNDYDTFQKLLREGRIVFGKTGEGGPQRKRFLIEAEERGRVSTTWWNDVETTADGTRLLQDQFNSIVFTNPKPVSLISRIVQLGTHDINQTVLDFFAGSGTTGHAVINLNREDGRRRKFILVEMAHYFDTVLLPRIKKVTFSPEWKDGKPKRTATAEEAERSPRIVKVIRLESYEDALNNIAFDEESGAKALELFKDDYLLRYMLRWETRRSETLLDVEKLQTPFSYKLHLYRDGETREHPVDLPETFNYLLGLDVETRRVYEDNGRRYLVYRGRLRSGRTTVVIWRETQGWMEEDYKRDADFIVRQKLNADADDVFVNGDSFVPEAQSLDPVFKERMFAEI